jgi:hypothetical protein
VRSGCGRTVPHACQRPEMSRTHASAATSRNSRHGTRRTRANTLRSQGADQRCTERSTTARTVCLWARRRLKKSARASCRSGGETDRRSTTATVQGISPFCDDGRILDIFGTESQLDSLSRAKLIKNPTTGAFLRFSPLSIAPRRKLHARSEHRDLQASAALGPGRLPSSRRPV